MIYPPLFIGFHSWLNLNLAFLHFFQFKKIFAKYFTLLDIRPSIE